MDALLPLLGAGAGSVAAYLAAHVLLCLLPAFFIAGALAALIPKASVTRWLGRNTPPWLSYPAAALAGSLIAVCSCTIVPLFAGIYRKGAGIGPATTFLFFAPAGNVMALAYTGSVLGSEFAIARLLLCLFFGVGIGLVMAGLFWRDDARRDAQRTDPFAERARITGPALGVLLSLVGLLIAGTLKLWPLTATVASVELPIHWTASWQATLQRWVPLDAARGQEGVSVQGALLIALLALVAVAARRGLEGVVEATSAWTWTALGLAAATLIAATLPLQPVEPGLCVDLTGRSVAVALALGAVVAFARRLPPSELRSWLWETWRFIKQIFGLLLIGVFVVGVARQLIRPAWIESIAGANSVAANAAAVGFGVFMYFPTLVEVPVARMFLDLGMHPGPLLAYLMADPELSLQSVLMVAAVMGRPKTAAYVGGVALFSLCAGLLYGAWVDGLGAGWLVLGVAALVFTVAGLLALLAYRRRHDGLPPPRPLLPPAIPPA